MHRSGSHTTALLLLFLTASPAWCQGLAFTISDATTIFEAVAILQDSTLSTANFRVAGSGSPDNLFYYNWAYRAPGAGFRGFNHVDTPAVNVSGNTATITWTNAGPGPVGQNRFDAVLTIQVTATSATTGRVDSRMVFTANAANTQATTWGIRHATDFDFNNSTSNVHNTTPNLPTSVAGFATHTGTSNTLNYEAFGGTVGLSAWEVSLSGTLRGKITGGSNTAFTNASTTFTGDGAVGYQWADVTLNPGESVTFTSTFAVVAPIPEPVAASLLVPAVVGLSYSGWRRLRTRRRRKAVAA